MKLLLGVLTTLVLLHVVQSMPRRSKAFAELQEKLSQFRGKVQQAEEVPMKAGDDDVYDEIKTLEEYEEKMEDAINNLSPEDRQTLQEIFDEPDLAIEEWFNAFLDVAGAIHSMVGIGLDVANKLAYQS